LPKYTKHIPSLSGLIFDFRTGDIIKISEHGIVCQASHGYVGDGVGWGGGGGLSEVDLCRTYGTAKKWPLFDLLKSQTKGDYLIFNTVFDVPVAFVCAR
jgi:hypothetical protein